MAEYYPGKMIMVVVSSDTDYHRLMIAAANKCIEVSSMLLKSRSPSSPAQVFCKPLCCCLCCCDYSMFLLQV